MQYYSHDDPFEREPLDSSSSTNSSRRPRQTPSSRRPIPATHDYSSPGPSSPYNSSSAAHTPYDNLNGNYYAPPPDNAPTPPRHGDNSYYTRGPPAHGEDMRYGESGPGGMSGSAYGAADRNAREHGAESAYGANHLPPPPSRTASGHYAGGGGYMYDGYNSRGGNSPMRSQTSSIHNSGYSNDPYADDPYRAFSGSNPRVDRRLGEFNPNDIEDDGDDGLYYPRHSQRNSMLSSAANSDRGARPAIGAAAVGGAAAAGGVMGGMLNRHRDIGPSYNLADGTEKEPSWNKKDKDGDGMSKKKKIAIMAGVVLVIIGIVVGSVVGALVSGRRGGGDSGGSDRGESAEDDLNKNGDLDINSDEIKELLNNPDLHRVFPGMDYTPIHAQYPDCMHHPPSQNNITRDMAVLSQLTNRVRLYGTDCNQTQMLIHAIDKLDLKGDVKIWLGVWQDDNSTTNARQLEQMWDVLEEYGDEPFEGLIVANEILFREEMTITELGDLLDDVRSNLTDLDLNLPVATSDLGDDWTSALGRTSDYIMSNIHPFFAGITADEAADWTMSFWNNNNGDFFKSDDKKNIISETGWPTGGGKNCGGASSCSEGSVAGIDELNTFMGDFVCQALKNGTNYFWFSAFDEPWKIAYNEDGKEWEDKWGLMDVNRNLKNGVKIPDCNGETI